MLVYYPMGRVGIWSDSFYRIIHKRQSPGCMELQCTPLTPALVVVTKTDVGTKNAWKIFIPRAGFEPRLPELWARDASITPLSSPYTRYPYLGQFRKYWIWVPFQILTRKKDFKSIPIRHFSTGVAIPIQFRLHNKSLLLCTKNEQFNNKIDFWFFDFPQLSRTFKFNLFWEKKLTMLLGARGQNLGFFSKICSKSTKFCNFLSNGIENPTSKK